MRSCEARRRNGFKNYEDTKKDHGCLYRKVETMTDAAPHISGLTVKGFKSIADEAHIDIRPITLLAGANSSGKSSIMQPLLLLKQTLEAPSDPGPLLLDGPNVRFTKAEQLLTRLNGDSSSSFAGGIALSNGNHIEFEFAKKGKASLELSKNTYTVDNKTYTLAKDISEPEIRDYISLFANGYVANDLSIRRNRCFFEVAVKDSSIPFIFYKGMNISQPILESIHLPGLRGNPQRDYPKTATGPNYQGAFEPYVASIVAQWQSEDRDRLKRLAQALRDMGLTSKVEAKRLDDTRFELMVGRMPRARRGKPRDLVSIADVGLGVCQSLPVLVALIAARPGQLVYLEQPEIHLHPRAQRNLARVICENAKRGAVAVIETHSVLLLREIQTLIAKGDLTREDVALHWFQRDDDGRTTIATADLDDRGAWGDWPEDFDKTELQAEQDYLDAVEKRGE